MIDFTTVPLPIPMPKKAWKLFGMFLTNMKYRQLKRGRPRMSSAKLIGAIVAQYVLKRSRSIQEEFARNEAECISAAPLPHFYTPTELANIRTATGAEVPDAIRAGSERRRTEYLAEYNRTKRGGEKEWALQDADR